MKSYRLIIGLALTLFLASAFAMPANAIGIYGQWQDSKDVDAGGYGLGLKHEFGIIPLVGIEARASWLRYSDDDSDANLDMYPLEAFGKLKLGMFYGGLGIGYYIMSGDYAPESTVGGFAAVGIDISLLGLGFFGEVRYLLLEPEYEDGFGGAVDMSGVGANIGVTLPIF